MNPEPSQGYVYLIKTWSADECFYKIGWSQQPSVRLDDLRTGNPFPMALVAVVYGSREKERELHWHWRHRHVAGEWFALTDEEVETMLAGADHAGISNFQPAPKRPPSVRKEPPCEGVFGRPMRPAAGLNGEILRLVAKRQDDGQVTWLMELCRQLGRNPGQVRPAVVRLLAHGFLRWGATEDRRAMLEITDDGRAQLHEHGQGRRIEPGELRAK